MSKYGRTRQTYGRPVFRKTPLQTRFSFKKTERLTSEQHKARWWRDKVELLRQNYIKKGKPVPSDENLNRAVARMWKHMRQTKKDGVLDGTYEYTGRGLASSDYYQGS